MRNLSKRLKEERLLRKLTQAQFAQLLELSLDTYKGYESLSTKRHRNPDLETIVKIATILNTTTDYLLGKDDI